MADAVGPRPTSHEWCAIADAVFHDKCLWVNDVFHLLISQAWTSEALADVDFRWPTLISQHLYVEAMVDVCGPF